MAVRVPLTWKLLKHRRHFMGITRTVQTAANHFLPQSTDDKQDCRTIEINTLQYFAGFNDPLIPAVREGPYDGLPHVVLANHNHKLTAKDWGIYCRSYLDDQLTQVGAVLFRGLPLSHGNDFVTFFDALRYQRMTYEGGATHRSVDDDYAGFYQASQEPPSVIIELHNEQSYFSTSPQKIIFYIKRPADPGCGGESLLCDNRKLLASLDSEYVKKATKKKIRYIRNCADKSEVDRHSWQDTFFTEDKLEVERALLLKDQQWEWKENNWLQFWNVIDATRKHPVTGEEVWFNQITLGRCDYYRFSPDSANWSHLSDSQCPTHATYGDGEEFEDDFVRHLRQKTFENTIAVNLQKGDFLVLDNFRIQHGRMPYSGERVLTTALLAD